MGISRDHPARVSAAPRRTWSCMKRGSAGRAHSLLARVDTSRLLSLVRRVPSRHNLHRLAPIARSPELFSRSTGGELPGASFPDSNLTPSNAQRRTIFALSTPPGKAGIGVVRISGPDTLQVWKEMIRPFKKSRLADQQVPEPWKMHRCRLVHPQRKEVLDSGLAVFFPGQ